MRAACALRISSGKIILNLQCRKIRGFSGIAFSRGGIQGEKKAPGSGVLLGAGCSYCAVVLVSSKPMAT